MAKTIKILRTGFSGKLFPAIIITLCILAYSKKRTLKPFKSDGCSLFPDKNFITGKDWCECCFKHDIAYWQGGTRTQRKEADQALSDCILKVSEDTVLARLVYKGVRFGGAPYFPNWYRWGYGWPYLKKYGELSAGERKQVEKMISLYFSEHPKKGCRQRRRKQKK